MDNLRTNLLGFTMIELLATITILGVLLFIAVPGLQSWLQNARIRNTAEAINNGIQLARSEAIRRNVNVVFTLNNDASWIVGCHPDNVKPDGDGDGVDDCPAVIQSRAAGEGSAGVAIGITPEGATEIVFNGFGRTRSGDIPISQVDIPAVPDGTNQYQVNIRGGTVKLCDPNANAGDPRQC